MQSPLMAQTNGFSSVCSNKESVTATSYWTIPLDETSSIERESLRI